MAKRRLNKKVAFIGSAILVVLLVGAIWVVLDLSRDPSQFIEDGDAAVLAKDYQAASTSYLAAFKRADNDEARKEILFKLVDVSILSGQWSLVLGYWDKIITIDTNNVRARFGRLTYLYIVAYGGNRQIWQQVHTKATELLNVAEQAGLLMEDVAKWDVFPADERLSVSQKLGAYLHLVKGRAALEMTILGVVTNKETTLNEAIADLEEVKNLEKDNIEVYRYLAGAAVEKGKLLALMGKFEEREKSAQEAKKILEEAVEIADNNPKAHANLLALKLAFARRAKPARDELLALEDEYLTFTKRFATSPEAFVALSEYYSDVSYYTASEAGLQYLDKAIKAIDKAVELDDQNVANTIKAMNLHYRRFSLYAQTPDLHKSMELAKKALTLPDAQETRGPWSFVNKVNRFTLYSLLAHSSIHEVLEPSETRTESETNDWVANAEDAVREIEQIFQSGQEPQVVKWRGMVDLAKGNRRDGVKKLHAAYEQIKTLKPTKPPWRRDSQFAYLSYILARVFKDSSEVGAVAEFLTSALYSGIADTVPEARLDYIEAILKFRLWSDAIENLDVFESRLIPNTRSRLLRIRTFIGAGEFDKAAEALAERPNDDPNTIELSLALVQARIRQAQLNIARTESKREMSDLYGGSGLEDRPDDAIVNVQFMKKELNGYRLLEVQLVEKLLSIQPEAVTPASIVGICRHYVVQDDVAKAKELADRYLRDFPDNADVLIYKQMLSEPEPGMASKERHDEITEKVLLSIAEPTERSLKLGVFYRRNQKLQEAVTEFKKVLNMQPPPSELAKTWCFSKAEDTKPRVLAARHIFDIALETEDWTLANEVKAVATRDDLDYCEGQVFAARLAYAKKDLDSALSKIDECLKQRPIFSRGYTLRSSINSALGKDHNALEDIRKAVTQDPLNAVIAKELARLLYIRNKNAGDNVTFEQTNEAKISLERAISLDPGDVQLRSFYADFIASKEPLKAVAILQALQRAGVTFANSIRLGELATNVARDETDAQRKEVLFAIAGAALEEAKKLKPGDKLMLHRYTEYLRAMGRDQEVKQLLTQANESGLLWNHYFQRGQYHDAEQVLIKLRETDPDNPNVVKGLLLVAEKTNNREAAEKYSAELVSLDPSVDNHLIQIQSYLRVGLVKEAGLKLQSFTENYPDEPRTLLLRAWLSMRKGQLEDALDLTNRYLQGNADNAAGWRLRGEIYFYAGDMTKAINDFKKSKSLATEAVTRVVLAKAYLRIARYEAAITELKMAISAPQAPLDARLLLEEAYKKLERTDSLKKFYDDTINEFPGSVFWLNRAATFAIDSEEFDRAEQLFGKAFQIKHEAYTNTDKKDLRFDALYASAFDGYMRTLILQAGTANSRTWNPKKLDEVFEQAKIHVDTDYAPLAFLRMAQAKMNLGHKKTAIEYCRKAVDKAEKNEALAGEVLLRMFLLLGPDETEKFCMEKLQANPDSLPANFTMFNLKKINRQYEEAIRYISKCIELTDADNPRRVDYTAKKAEILTLAYQRRSDNKFLIMAIADYESLLAKMPNNISVLNNLAFMLAENNERLPDALKYSQRAYETMSNDPEILDTYGYVLHKNGKSSEAVEYLAASLQQYEQRKTGAPPDIFEHLGMAREAIGDKLGALADYEQALQVGAGMLSGKAKKRINEAIERLSP